MNKEDMVRSGGAHSLLLSFMTALSRVQKGLGMTNGNKKIRGLMTLSLVAGSLVAAVPAKAWDGDDQGRYWDEGRSWGGHDGHWSRDERGGYGWGRGTRFGNVGYSCWRWTPYGWARICY